MNETKEYAREFTVSTAINSGPGFYTGETVFQADGITGATLGQATSIGTVIDWSLLTNTLTVSSITDTPFAVGATQSIQGEKSGTEYFVTGTTLTNLIVPENIVSNTPDGDADTLGVEKQGILDFSETDPLSEGNY